jgi:phosphonatase-like hydrolase
MSELAVFDVAGTVVTDEGIVIESFQQAFAMVVPITWADKKEEFMEYAESTMGQSKVEVFKTLLGDDDLVKRTNDEFQNAYLERLEEIEPIPGVETLFENLRSAGVKVALNTGFNRETLNTIIYGLGWQELIDSTATQTETGKGRPAPDMLEWVARECEVSDPSKVAILGDTVSDIEAGANFGAGQKIGVLTGFHDQQMLKSAGADVVFETAVDALDLLTS